MSLMFLSQPEIVDLTGRRQVAKQRQALVSMGIPFVTAADGKLRVARQAVEAVLCPSKPIRKQTAPDELALMRLQRGS